MTLDPASSMAMATLGQDRTHLHRENRPPMLSQLSSSVPSTPHQQARDLRFPSRSPSPGQRLSNTNPRGLLPSDARNGPRLAQRGPPEMCRFEQGAEYPKRRIPYKDGGNEPLPPPKEEPKKALQPFEDDKLSGDMRELYDRILPSAESEERRQQLVKKLQDIMNKEWPGDDITVNVFGSSGNLLSSSESDVDICITTPLKKLETMHGLAKVLHEHGMEQVLCRAYAKVPIIKMWDPQLQLACDMNVNNPLALENTRMIKTYVQMDDRVRPLAKIVKYWTKRRLLNDAAYGGTISSYTWICMILNFLQTRDPPILPSLQKMPETQKSSVNGQKSSFADDLEQLRGYGSANKESLGQLLFRFFRYYGYGLDYTGFVVSVKEGRLLSRKEKKWDVTNYHDKEARSRLCVEEPFNTNRNLGNSADEYAFTGIHREIRRAFDLIASMKFEECFEQFEFPVEEKPIFQRPAAKPKPVLTRSASQTNRPSGGPAAGRGNANNARNSRNTSSHRNSRRASSGAAPVNGIPRFGYLQSPGPPVTRSDYFGVNGLSPDHLHDQLSKQYAILQAQQEALRSQLLPQPQVQGQAQASPRQRSYTNGMLNSRILENAPQSAPLLPGYLYHYPARYPQTSPLIHARTSDGIVTSPSSPSMPTITPSSRRAVQRSSVTDTNITPTTRSQSQPGRTFPNPLTLQSLAHPGYDVSGAIGMPYFATRPVQVCSPGLNGQSLPYYQHTSLPNTLLPAESAMPKEYVGYYVGQSPQLGPHFGPVTLPPVSNFQDLTQRSRRLSPGAQSQGQGQAQGQGLSNGVCHTSRSPSPLGHARDFSRTSNPKSDPLPQVPFPARSVEGNGPLIVNGSNVVAPVLSAPGLRRDSIGLLAELDDAPTHGLGFGSSVAQAGSQSEIKAAVDNTNGDESITTNGVHAHNSLQPEERLSPQIAPSSRPRMLSHLDLAANGDPLEELINGAADPQHQHHPTTSPLAAAPPLLSPVAEMRTPSPGSMTSPHLLFREPIKAGHMKTFSETNALAREVLIGTNGAAATAAAAPPPLPGLQGPVPSAARPDNNPWQQATTKRHKKGKSRTIIANGISSSSSLSAGEPMPANEAERKGG